MAFADAYVNSILGWIFFVVVLFVGIQVKKFQTYPISGALIVYWILIIIGMIHDSKIHDAFNKTERAFTAQKAIEHGLHHPILLILAGIITHLIMIRKNYILRSPISFEEKVDSKALVKATETDLDKKPVEVKEKPKKEELKEEKPKKENPQVGS